MSELDCSALAREITSSLARVRAPASAFRLIGTAGSPDGSVTIEFTAADPAAKRTFTVTVAYTPAGQRPAAPR